MTTLSPLPSSFRNTCNSMHALAEHVLSTARYQGVERFVLQPNPRGFETPPFGEDNTVLAVEGIELVVTDNRGSRPDTFWNAGFGALLRYSQMKSHENAVEFLWRGRELCSPSTSNGASSK